MMKHILITGANSYIGDNVRDYLLREPEKYDVSVKDTINWKPTPSDFKDIDVVFNVAGIAHIKETKQNRHLYYEINRDLVVEIAKTAKLAGVRHFIALSSMSVYGLLEGYITKETPVNPKSAYGKSKAEADEEIKKLEDDVFRFACLRPPMVYGKGCKGNYQKLRNFVLKSPVFPDYKNQRSMIYIGNLCEFVKEVIDEDKHGLFFPQNSEYVCTSEMAKLIAEVHGKKLLMTRVFNYFIAYMHIKIFKKVFGNLSYERADLISRYNFVESLKYNNIKNNVLA